MKRLIEKNLSWDRAFWLLLVGLAAAFGYLNSRIHVFLAGDAIAQFAPEVVGLLSGQGIKAFAIDPYRGPLFPTLVAGVGWVLRGDVFSAGQVVEVAAYLLFIVAAFGVIRAAFNSKLAFLTAAVIGACAPVLANGLAWLTDILFVALALLALWCMAGAERRWAWSALGAGLLAGLAFDTRWNGLFLLGVAIIGVALNPWRMSLARRFSWLVVLILGFALVAVPWLSINNAIHGSPFYNRLNEVSLDPSLVLPKLGASPALKTVVLTDPVFFFPRYFFRLVWTGPLQVSQIVPLVLAIFIPAGLLVFVRQVDPRKWLLLIFSGLFWAIAVLTHFEPRYYFPLLPILVVLPLFFLLSDAVPDLQLPGQVSVKLCLLLFALAWIDISGFRGAQASAANTNAGFEPQVEVAQILAAPPPGAVTGVKVALEYYSGARYFIPHDSGLPVGILKTPDDYLKPPADYSHVFVEEGVPLFKVPANLLDPLLAGPQLEAVYYKAEKPRALLYQVLPDNHLWPLQAITVSAAVDDAHGPAAVLDADSQTGWLTPPAAAPDAPATLTVDLGQLDQLNRLWLLPPPNPVMFPESYVIETSPDGTAWTQVALVDHAALNQRQNPRVFIFAARSARFVRFSALRLRPNLAGQYQSGLNGLRVSLSSATQP